MSEFVAVKSCTYRMDAELAKAVLEANGIEARISGDDAGGMQPMTGRIRILVAPRDALLARRLLEEPEPPGAA